MKSYCGQTKYANISLSYNLDILYEEIVNLADWSHLLAQMRYQINYCHSYHNNNSWWMKLC